MLRQSYTLLSKLRKINKNFQSDILERIEAQSERKAIDINAEFN